MRLLCLSNGHGEDQIAIRILTELRQLEPDWAIAALPLVGEGHAFAAAQIARIGPRQVLPSGGFLNQDWRQLLRDLAGGLTGLTFGQWQAVRQWSESGSAVLAVGDIVPLLFAWASDRPFAFVATAKSDYYWRDEQGLLPISNPTMLWSRWQRSYFDPWDRWLMKHPRCRAVFPRDRLTAEGLQQLGVPAIAVGNPMMDGLEAPEAAAWSPLLPTGSRWLLLPGSRPPEAQRNWSQIIDALPVDPDRAFVALAAIAPSLPLAEFTQGLSDRGWQPAASPIPEAIVFQKGAGWCLLGQRHFAPFLQLAEGTIAMAGTATEQCVGLGKPAFTIAGQGPQFTRGFAEAQTRLLGLSVQLLSKPSDFLTDWEIYQADLAKQEAIATNGRLRLGEAGAAARIAEVLRSQLLESA
ncbi:lipid-A-disaccharide synthase-related protein [Synechococcus elongatus]|uniref:lipid-A-disaccharide synthase-related protein n=1 Tax=Synechococcus elongatus TaxID=32046 RepID=UPI000F7D8D65|nr:lipid-A-disaccharide synthase-related protein [Synechococcus elongatus]